jgi:hypothetical protein
MATSTVMTRSWHPRVVAAVMAFALCALAITCAWASKALEAMQAFGARAGAFGGAASLAPTSVLSFLSDEPRARGVINDVTLALVAKVCACASAACAVAAIVPGNSSCGSDGGALEGEGAKAGTRGDGTTTVRVTTKNSSSAASLSPKASMSPAQSPRVVKTSEDIARAKEAAKERKRRAREEQEIAAKREEAERAEIARLVELERKKREAAEAAAEEAALAKRTREEEEARVDAARRAAIEIEDKKRRDEMEARERDAAAAKAREAEEEANNQNNISMKKQSPVSTTTMGVNGDKATVAPLANAGATAPPSAPRSTGLTLRSIPTPRINGGGMPMHQQPPVAPPPLPAGPPPLPAGPPPPYAKLAASRTPAAANNFPIAAAVDDVADPPLPPMAPLLSPKGALSSPDTPRESFSRWSSLSSERSVGDNGGQFSAYGAVPPRPVVPPGFEHVPLSPTFNGMRQPRSSFTDEVDADSEWAAVDSTIQLFLESTASDAQSYQPQLSSDFGNIFRPNAPAMTLNALSHDANAAPPLPPTPHPEMLSGILANMDDE